MPPVIVTADNLRPPLFDVIVDQYGKPTKLEQQWRSNLTLLLKDISSISVKSLGARGDGSTDDTAAFQNAIAQATQQGGGVIFVPPGKYSISSIKIPSTAPPITLMGQGTASMLIRRGTLPVGVGLLDVFASNFSLANLLIDGGTTVPVGLRYNTDFLGIGGDDPMASVLTRNTSVWVHGGATMLSVNQVFFQHAGGYSILLDATAATIQDVDITNCWFENNRPTLFGTSSTALIYGSWNGGVLAQGDGRTANSSVVKGLLVTECRFKRNDGNCLWSHLYGLNALHEDFRFIGNHFVDCGLDGILVGGVTNGVVANNTFRRIGYTTQTDSDKSVPRWLANANATALDSSGIVKNVPYVSNSFLSINGGCLDLDGHGQSVISGNVCKVPYLDEPEYTEDRIAISGPNNNGSGSYGVNCNNSSQIAEGDAGIAIVGNSLINLPGGSIRFYGSRNNLAGGNLIISPAAPLNPPIAMGPVGANASQRCYGNRVSGNYINYAPGSSKAAIIEDDTITSFLSTEINDVHDNIPIGNANVYEFKPSTHSGSKVSPFFPPSLNFIAVENGANSAIACAAGSGQQLTPGLQVSILLAHTLTGGAGNTLAYNGGAALAIKSHFNPGNNISTGYAVGAVVTLLYDGTEWQDLSQ